MAFDLSRARTPETIADDDDGTQPATVEELDAHYQAAISTRFASFEVRIVK